MSPFLGRRVRAGLATLSNGTAALAIGRAALAIGTAALAIGTSAVVILASAGPAAADSNTPAVALTASPASNAVAGSSVTLTATLSGTSATPGGTVEFTSGGATISGCGTQPLSTAGGVTTATCTTTALTTGTDLLAAVYSGSGPDASATSADLPYTVLSTGSGGAAPTTCSTAPFVDVPVSNPFCADIDWLTSQKIATGYADGTFHPTAAVTREAMAAFLYRSVYPVGEPAACTSSPFADVPVSSPFCPQISWLVTQRIAIGYADGGFHPTAAVSRQAMAALLYELRYPDETAAACATPTFTDVPVSSVFCGDINWLVNTKVASGYADGGFHPVSPVSREAMAAFLHRLAEAKA